MLTITVVLRQNLKYDRPYPDIKASKDSAVIAQGRQLVMGAAHCADCHSKSNVDSLMELGAEVPLTGGMVFDLPFGKLYTPNITQDKETGIGNFTDAEIARSLRYGVHPDGTVVYGVMPFQNMTDEDLTAIISYLRTVKPIRSKAPAHDLNPLGNIIKAFLVKPAGPHGEVPKKITRDTSVAYGKYLATVIANCNGCHTKRAPTGAFIGDHFSGGNPMIEHGIAYTPPNLLHDSSGRIFSWSQQMFIERFRKGELIKGSPMPWVPYKRMSDDELKAIYHFLKTLHPSKSKQAQ